MKKLLLLVIFASVCHISASAQWYERSCGVQEIESATSDAFECLWNKADKVVEVGMSTCRVGTGITVMGGITMFVSSGSDTEASSGYSMIGALAIASGLAVVAVSIPIWAVGSSRKSKLMDSPAYQEVQGASVQISPIIDKNHLTKQASLGLAVFFNF
jgi:hypothetical protein